MSYLHFLFNLVLIWGKLGTFSFVNTPMRHSSLIELSISLLLDSKFKNRTNREQNLMTPTKYYSSMYKSKMNNPTSFLQKGYNGKEYLVSSTDDKRCKILKYY